jgi:NitT/TauT family transport system permease protein
MLKNKTVRRVAAVIFALSVWQIAAMIADAEFLFPSPIDVILRLFTVWREDGFFIAISNSFLKIVSGFLLGLILGTALAIISARFSIIEDLLWPFMITIKSVPVASFVVLALMWLTSRSLSSFISFLMVLPIIYTNILGGIKNSDREMDKMATVFRMPLGRRIIYIWIPRIKPFMLSACSIALGLSWRAGIAAELIGIPDGSLGEMLYYAKIYFNSLDLFAWTVIIVILSIGFEKLFISILKLVFRRIEKI